MMKKLLVALYFLPFAALAADKHDAEQVKKDIERHRQMATAHDIAAKCLASGQKAELCQRELQGACKGIAIGKFCGMKHEH